MTRRAHLVLVLVLVSGCVRLPLQLGDDRDAGAADAGRFDGGAIDGGSARDAGRDDAGTRDASTGDAGAPLVDGGVPSGPLVVAHLALGGDASCALLADGRVACWGADDRGQLALESEVWFDPRCPRCIRTPVLSPHLAAIVELELGRAFGCARSSRGTLSCWGDNRFGQLGRLRGPDSDRHPLPLEVRRDVVELALGRHHACARDASGQVACWGLAEHGQLGRPGDERCTIDASLAEELGVATREVACSSTPRLVEGLGPVDAIGAGDHHTCALRGGEVVCWGRNHRGQLGDGTLDDRAFPTLVGAVFSVTELAVGGGTTFGLGGATLTSWGDGSLGQLAIAPVDLDACGSGRCVRTPDVRSRSLTHVAAGRAHACGLDVVGRVACWGLAEQGRLGGDVVQTCDGRACAFDPVEPAGLGTGVRTVAVGDAHACALAFSDGDAPSVFCWGSNHVGQLGLGTVGEPVTIPTGIPVTR